jgi:sulfate adenylyltransferase
MTRNGLNAPHGGALVDLIVGPERAAELRVGAKDLASLTLGDQALCDLELLATGAFSPLKGFLGRRDCERVMAEMRLADGAFWPVPVTLPVERGEGIEEGKAVGLRDVYGNLLAVLHIEEIYPSGAAEGGQNAAGRLEVLRVPPHYDFVDLRLTPAELRARFKELGWEKVVAFPAREPLHRADEEGARRAAGRVGGGLLVWPVVGAVKPGDADHFTRVRCYRAAVEDEAGGTGKATLSLLPLGERGAGARGLLLEAIVGRNCGGTHLLVGPDREGIEEARLHEAEIGVEIIEAPRMVYLPGEDRYAAADEVPAGASTASLTSEQAREEYLARGLPLPAWYTRPAVAEILREANPPRTAQGLTIWFTGLSGSGKSTVAHGLVERLAEFGRNVSTLDGDEIRTHLSKGLGFSREDRDTNVRRVGYVAGLVSRHGGTILCSVISPYRAVREEAREMSRGNFVEVYCETPIEVCEQRDVKGLYAKARAAVAEGKGLGFTGIDDPYEPPAQAEVTLDTSRQPVAECVDRIIEKLLELGYIRPHGRR